MTENTRPPRPSRNRLVTWFKRRTEGRRIMQWISYVMIFSVLIIFIIASPPGKPDWRYYATVLILAALLVLNILWDQSHDLIHSLDNPRIYKWGFNLLTDVLILGGIALTGRFEIVFLLFMQVAQFSAFIGVWPGGAIVGVINLAITLGMLVMFGVDVTGLIQAGAELGVGLIFVLVFVYLEEQSYRETLRAERLLKDLQAANLELKAAHKREKDLAIAEERMRLARDIHDGLGHHLTVLSIQLQAADKLVQRNPQAAAEAIQTCRSEAQAALEEVRRSVGMMRETPAETQPLVEMVAGLVHDFSGHTGLEIQFEHSGQPPELSAFANQTLYRAVQESLTNVQKHARGVKRILVGLTFSAEAVRLSVSDDGDPSATVSSGPVGFGLKGLQERVDQLGGELCCGPASGGGFQVDVTLPLREVLRDQNPVG
jgi:signal transduction histidine kinase